MRARRRERKGLLLPAGWLAVCCRRTQGNRNKTGGRAAAAAGRRRPRCLLQPIEGGGTGRPEVRLGKELGEAESQTAKET